MVAINSRSGSATGLLGSFLAAALPAQGSWSQTPALGHPALLASHAAVYDLARDRMVLNGGHGPTFVTEAVTWEFDGLAWTSTPPLQSPPGRYSHAMAYDAARGLTVLFGGQPSAAWDTVVDDTWEYDGSTWMQITPAIVPPPRRSHAMAYDLLRNRVVMFGGWRSNANNFNDTWEYDGNTWTPRQVPGPTGRCEHAMCFDMVRARTVLFGGTIGLAVNAETWEWDGISWQQHVPTTSPGGRAGHAMAYDLARSVSVLHGGDPNGAETWEWDGVTWQQHGSAPIGKTNHTLVYDARLQRVTRFGGFTLIHPITVTTDVETYGHPNPGAFTPRGSSCPGSAGTPQLFAPNAVTGPTIGQATVVQVSPAWSQTFFAFGWSDLVDGTTPLPYDLAGYGMPGCSLQVSRDYITSSIPGNGTATLLVPIGNNPFFVGLRFYVQGFVLDLGANAGGFSATNRLEGIVGRI